MILSVPHAPTSRKVDGTDASSALSWFSKEPSAAAVFHNGSVVVPLFVVVVVVF